MNTSKLLEKIANHDAYKHPIFQMLAEKKPEDEKLEAWLWNMGQFCEASRSARNMPMALQQTGFTEQAKLIREIHDSECGHGPQYELMATHLLGRRLGTHFKPEATLRNMQQIFRRRANRLQSFMRFSLGVYLAVEIMANRHIIPGEIYAFISSGHYGVTVLDPEMEYLREHAGEDGAEASHEKRMIQVLAEMPDEDGTDIEEGIAVFMDGLNRFYDMLAAMICTTT